MIFNIKYFIVTGLFVLVTFVAKAQPYENLVFEGAGVRGIAYVGVIQQLDSMGILKNIKRVGGTSAGAIAATAIALDYNSQELESLLYSLEITDFNDGRWFFIGGFNRMINKYGYYPGNKFSKWIGKIIEAKTGDADITFFDMSQRGYKDLFITGTSINNQKLIIFSKETYPYMKVRDAVRISMAIPFYFEPIIIDSTGKIIKDPELGQYYDMMIDGGVTANFPIRIFDNKKYNLNCDSIDREVCINDLTLAIRVDSDEQIKLDEEGNKLAAKDIKDIKDYTVAFYRYLLENLNRQTLIPEDWERTISVSSAGIDPRIKKLSFKEKEKLIESGRAGVNKFFNDSKFSIN